MKCIPNDRYIRNDLALQNYQFKKYIKAKYCRKYAITMHSCLFLILTLSALPGT